MKKILIIILIVLVVILGYLLKKHNDQKSLIDSLTAMTPEGRGIVNENINEIVSGAEKLQGTPLSKTDNENVIKVVIDANTKASDAGIKSIIEQFYPTSELYYSFNNGNYGISKTENVCVDVETYSLEQLKQILKYSKEPANCNISSTYPAKTFTVTAQSLLDTSPMNSGFYCTDQNGFQGFVRGKSQGYISGIKCK